MMPDIQMMMVTIVTVQMIVSVMEMKMVSVVVSAASRVTRKSLSANVKKNTVQ